MYRNILEKLFNTLTLASIANRLHSEVYSSLITWLNKCNYMEYIRVDGFIGANQCKPPCGGKQKGTLWGIINEGSVNPVKVLCVGFQTWLYFLNYQNNHQRTSHWALFHYKQLGYIFEKVVIK